MKRKKKGSTLIVVVMIFGFLVIFAGGMLAMTSGEYKLRVAESKRVQNLYGAESGIDVVQNLIGKTFEAAVKYANIKIEQFKTGSDEYVNNTESKAYKSNIAVKEGLEKQIQLLNSNTSLKEDEKKDKKDKLDEQLKKVKADIDTILNNEFKKQFNKFMKPGDPAKACNEDEVSGDELRKALAHKKYIKSFKDNGMADSYEDVTFDTEDKPEIFYFKSKKKNDDGKINYDGIQPVDEKMANTTELDKIYLYKIKITSEFKSSKSNVGANRRTVQANFELKVPNYKDTKSSENKKVVLNDYPVISQKLMTVDGNMNINTPNQDNPVNFYGNVHVTGNPSKAAGNYGSSPAYTKYKGGVSINNSIVNFMSGYIATGETFNIESNSKVNADDIYARNVYVGVKDGQSMANAGTNNSNELTVTNSIFTDNDLTLKADRSTISMDNFYGLNDKNVSDNKSIFENKAKTSSSILVNGGENSSLTVNKQAVIMGVGYINAGTGYMTGESTAVKGNYLAYADPSDYPNVDLQQYGNLQLIDDTKLDVFKKSEKFQKYWEAQKDADNGGISLPSDTVAIGAFFYRDGNDIKIKSSTYKSTNQKQADLINDKKTSYGSKIFRLGKGAVDKDKYDEESGRWTVKNKVNFDVTDAGYTVEGQASKKYKFIYSKNKNVVIKGTDTEGKDVQINKENGEIDIYGQNVNAVIITGGNVTIEGNVKFTGNIIAEGDVNISDAGEKDLVYDQNISNLIQAENIDMVNKIFFDKSGAETFSSYVSTSEDSEGDISQYDVGSYLKSKLWRIVI